MKVIVIVIEYNLNFINLRNVKKKKLDVTQVGKGGWAQLLFLKHSFYMVVLKLCCILKSPQKLSKS